MAVVVTAQTFPKPGDHIQGSSTPLRGLRGGSGGIFVGPSRPAAASHITGSAGGGVAGSTGYRKSGTYDGTGSATTMAGAGGNTIQTVARPTGRTAYLADGVQGGSILSSQGTFGPVDTTGRAAATGLNRFGREP